MWLAAEMEEWVVVAHRQLLARENRDARRVSVTHNLKLTTQNSQRNGLKGKHALRSAARRDFSMRIVVWHNPR
jgi:hypothetical protein